VSETTALHHLAQEGHFEVIKLLVEHGSDVQSADALQMTPLQYAVLRVRDRSSGKVRKDDLEALNYLDWKSQEIHRSSARLEEEQQRAAEEGNESIIEHYTKLGAGINAQDMNGRTLLHFAAKSNNLATVKLLVERRYDPRAFDSNGNVPATYATHQDVINYLECQASERISGLDRYEPSGRYWEWSIAQRFRAME
jgi:ankyrin repeat protein